MKLLQNFIYAICVNFIYKFIYANIFTKKTHLTKTIILRTMVVSTQSMVKSCGDTTKFVWIYAMLRGYPL